MLPSDDGHVDADGHVVGTPPPIGDEGHLMLMLMALLMLLWPWSC